MFGNTSTESILFAIAVILLVIAVLLFILEKVFDYTCDKNSMFEDLGSTVRMLLLASLVFAALAIYCKMPVKPKPLVKCTTVQPLPSTSTASQD